MTASRRTTQRDDRPRGAAPRAQTAPRLTAVTESWNLKLKRAWHTCRDLDERVHRVTGGRERRDIRVQQSAHGSLHRYTAHCEVAVDEMLPVVIGECLFNARSALDHIAVANVPSARRREAQFPIITANIEGPVTAHSQDSRANWDRWTQGMNGDVLDVIRRAQPYKLPPAEHHAFAILSSFQNADKHRELNIVVEGIGDAIIETDSRILDLQRATGFYGMLRDGAQVALESRPAKVRVTGIPKLAMTRGEGQAHHELPDVLQDILLSVGEVIERVQAVM